MPSDKPNYQLTPYPIGSFREIWTVSWPLILGFMSMSIMMFTDRLLLSRYSYLALNGASVAGTAAYTFLVLPLMIAAISEVFVGRFHGEGRLKELGKPVWQMIWFSLAMTPIFFLFAAYLPHLIFWGSENFANESQYFTTIVLFAPFFFGNIAVAGFFVGCGKVRIVTAIAVISNLLNIILDYAFIYGWGSIPSLGITGAALATGVCEIAQYIALLTIMLNKKYRIQYGTAQLSFDKKLLFESLRIGFPMGLGITVEVLAHSIFLKLISFAGQQELAIASLTQSFYFLIFFLYEGLSKGVTTIVSNLLGAEKINFIKKVIRSAIKTQLLFSVSVAAILFFFSNQIIDLFFNQTDEHLLLNANFILSVKTAFFWMTIFYLFDGFSRVMMGHLTAAGDTKFLFYAGTVLNISAYILPLFLVIYILGGGAAAAWMIIAAYSLTMFLVYYWRYRGRRWVEHSKIVSERSKPSV